MSPVSRPIKFGILGFVGGKENQTTTEKVSGQGQDPTTNSTPMWCQVQESSPGHGHGRQALSPQSYPCSLLLCKRKNESSELTTTGSIILEKTVHTDNFSILCKLDNQQIWKQE